MAAPVLVRAYRNRGGTSLDPPNTPGKQAQALPPISSYTFAAILRSSDGPDFQQAIDGIAEICAKNRMSLADEYSSHLPPLGEITAANSTAARPQMFRPGMRRALTSVPEASSGSSEGSRKSGKKRASGLFSFRRKEKEQVQSKPMRQMRIGSMGRVISVTGTTAMASNLALVQELEGGQRGGTSVGQMPSRPALDRTTSEAVSSLERLLHRTRNAEAGENG